MTLRRLTSTVYDTFTYKPRRPSAACPQQRHCDRERALLLVEAAARARLVDGLRQRQLEPVRAHVHLELGGRTQLPVGCKRRLGLSRPPVASRGLSASLRPLYGRSAAAHPPRGALTSRSAHEVKGAPSRHAAHAALQAKVAGRRSRCPEPRATAGSRGKSARHRAREAQARLCSSYAARSAAAIARRA